MDPDIMFKMNIGKAALKERIEINSLEDIKPKLMDECKSEFEERNWFWEIVHDVSTVITRKCISTVEIIWNLCQEKYPASSCEWYLREAIEDFCYHFPTFIRCKLIPTKPPPRTTTESTSTSTTTPSTTTKYVSTEDRVANMIMYTTIGGSIFLLFICIILYIFYRQAQADRRAREMREARMWGKDWMNGMEEGLEEGFKDGIKGWTSSATSGTTGGTTGTKKDKKKKNKTTRGTTSKTETTGTWL
ncbi:unnamed protein product [Caenorhabditis nigoni]